MVKPIDLEIKIMTSAKDVQYKNWQLFYMHATSTNCKLPVKQLKQNKNQRLQ
jgi:hypothetical protein